MLLALLCSVCTAAHKVCHTRIALYIPTSDKLEQTFQDHLHQPIHVELLNDCNEDFIACFNMLNNNPCLHNLLSVSLRCKNKQTFDELREIEKIASKIRQISFSYNFQTFSMDYFKKFSNLCRIRLTYLLQTNPGRKTDFLLKNSDFKEKTAVLEFLQKNGQKNGEEAGVFFREMPVAFVCEKRQSQDNKDEKQYKFQRSHSLPNNKLKPLFSPDLLINNNVLKQSHTQESLVPDQRAICADGDIGELQISVPENDIDGRKIVGILSNSLQHPIKIHLTSTADQIRALDEFFKNNPEKLNHIQKLKLSCTNHKAFYALKKSKCLAPKINHLIVNFALQKKDLTSNFELFDHLTEINTPNINCGLLEESGMNNKMHKNSDNSKIVYGDSYPGISGQTLSIKSYDIRYHDILKILKCFTEIYTIHIEEPCQKEFLNKLIRLEKDGVFREINSISLIAANSEVFNLLCTTKSLSDKVYKLELDYVPRTKFSEPKYSKALSAFKNLEFFLAKSEDNHGVLPKSQDMYALCHSLGRGNGYIQLSCPGITYIWSKAPRVTTNCELLDHQPCFTINQDTLHILSETPPKNGIISSILEKNSNIQRAVIEINRDDILSYLNILHSTTHHDVLSKIYEFAISIKYDAIISKLPHLNEVFRTKITELRLSFVDANTQNIILTQLNIFPNLQSLQIKETPEFRSDYFQYFKNLKKIKIDFWHPFSNDIIPYLAQCTRLTELSLFGCCIKDDGLSQLAHIPLKKVTFKSAPHITVQGLSYLPLLESIDWRQNQQPRNEDLVQHLSHLDHLQELILSDHHENICKNDAESTPDYLKRLLRYNILQVVSVTAAYENLLTTLKNDHKFDTLSIEESCSNESFKKINSLKNAKVLEKITALFLTCANSTVFNQLCKSKTLSNKTVQLTLDYIPKTKFSEPKYGKALSAFKNLRFFFAKSDEEYPILPKCREMYILCENLVNKNGYIQITGPHHTRIWAKNPPTIGDSLALWSYYADYRITNDTLCVFLTDHLQKNILQDILARHTKINHMILTGTTHPQIIKDLDQLEKLITFKQIYKFSIDCTNDDTLIQLYQASQTLRSKVHSLKFCASIDRSYMIKTMKWDILKQFQNLKIISMVKPDILDTIHNMFFNYLTNSLLRDHENNQNYGLKLTEKNTDTSTKIFQEWPVDFTVFDISNEILTSATLDYLTQNQNILGQVQELSVWVDGEQGLQEILESNLKEKITGLKISSQNRGDQIEIIPKLTNFPKLKKYEYIDL